MSGPNRYRVLLTAVVGSATLLILVVLFVNATTASRVAANAERLHWTNATLGTAALARLAAGQVATFEQLTDADVVPDQALGVALAELDDVNGAFDDLVEAAPPRLAAGLADLSELLSARPVDMSLVEAAYQEQAGHLRAELADIQAEIEVSQSSAGHMSAAVRLLVTLILPVAAIVVYRRRAALQVQEAQVRMEAQVEAERDVNRAKDQFIAGMSHEIRTPLTAIHGFSEVLMDSPPEAGVDREMVSVINNESAELGRMVDDFIAASRLDGPGLDVELVETDLTQIAHQVVERFRHRGATIPIVGTAPLALADPGRTRQVLVNLISNAIHHGAEPISIVLDGDDSAAMCAVIDHGPGVTPDMQERLYSRFIHQGTDVLLTGTLGLGTWVAREFARAMGGTVTHTRIDDETLFVLSLPATNARATAPVREDVLVEAGSAP